MRSWSIRAWLALLIALSVLPPVILAIIFVVRSALDEQERTLDRVQQTTRAMIAAIDGYFDSRIALLRGLASSTALERGDVPEFRRRAAVALQALTPGPRSSFSMSRARS